METRAINTILDKCAHLNGLSIFFGRTAVCNASQGMLKIHLKNHHIVLDEVILDHEDGSTDEIKQRLNGIAPIFLQLLLFFIFKMGKVYNQLEFTINMEEKFNSWVVMYKLDNNPNIKK